MWTPISPPPTSISQKHCRKYALPERSNLNRQVCRIDLWILIRLEADHSRPLENVPILEYGFCT
jgi:hypothetical protein